MVLRPRNHPPPDLPLRGYHPLWRTIPGPFGSAQVGGNVPASTPHHERVIHARFGLGWSPFTRRYSGSLVLISFPPPTQMLPFGGFPHPPCGGCFLSRRLRKGYPFSNPRIKGCMLLPGAYRRLPRPSSAVEPIHPPGSVLVPRTQLPIGTVCELPVTHS